MYVLLLRTAASECMCIYFLHSADVIVALLVLPRICRGVAATAKSWGRQSRQDLNPNWCAHRNQKKTRDTMTWWLGRLGTVSSNDHKRCITMCLFFSIMKLFRALHISHTMRSQSLTLTLHHLLQFRHPLCPHRQQGSNRSMRSQRKQG